MPQARRNRLAHATSPYLLQHQSNPVDWFPWGEEAFAKARAEDKPIFLSVGYSACHWCHVMEKDAFSVEEVADLLNENFVSIKVDREERPDVDQLYQGVVQLMGKSGGWPLSVFMTPDGRPFFGGTYFPPQDAFGLPSFSRILQAIRDAWTERRQEVEASADSFEEGLSKYLEVGMGEGERPPSVDELGRAAEGILEAFDDENGGFFGAPKFPHPMELSFLLRLSSLPLKIDEGLRFESRRALEASLEAMARGGIFDQLGGGFHRYTVDEAWVVPHFEKMLYDNALLLRLYAEASRAFGRRQDEEVVFGIVNWLDEMRDPQGAFFSAQDADSEGEEGKYFVWSPEEFDEILGMPLAELAKERFGVRPGGNFEKGKTVLTRAASIEELATRHGKSTGEIEDLLREARERLLEARRKRVAPAVDDKVLASWNGLAIGALAVAGRYLEDAGLVGRARRAADAVLSRLWDGERLLRTYRGDRQGQPAFLDDHAFLCEGLTELFETTGEVRWLEMARKLAKRIVSHFWEEETRTFYLSPADGERLLHRVHSSHDQAIPSGASTAVMAFLRLFPLTGEEELGRIAEAYLARQSDAMVKNPFAFGHLLSAALLRAKGITEVAILGRAGPEREALLSASREGFRPDILAYAAEQGAGPAMQGRAEVDGKPAAWICRHFACERPRTEPEDVRDALRV